jgi:hypothetical protein
MGPANSNPRADVANPQRATSVLKEQAHEMVAPRAEFAHLNSGKIGEAGKACAALDPKTSKPAPATRSRPSIPGHATDSFFWTWWYSWK